MSSKFSTPTTHNALSFLASKPDFAYILNTFGEPPAWQREASFATLVHIILEQQVSLASAKAAFDKLNTLLFPITPEAFLSLDDISLKSAYFSRQKIRYTRALAEAILNKRLNLANLENLSDDEARAELTKITGIGRWSANIYLLMALNRQDIWPKGDVALATAYHNLKRKILNESSPKPSQDDLEQIAQDWRPYRSMTAKLLWHYYLSAKALKGQKEVRI